jgi:hypothetical protein
MPYWSVVEGYNGTPLSIKLGIKESSTVVVLHAPTAFVLEVANTVSIRRQMKGRADVVLAFFTRRSQLAQQIEAMGMMIVASGGLWIAWPKKVSKVATDLTDHVVRNMALPLGLVDNKVCAVDATWTGLRLVWRLSAREHLTQHENASS